MLLSIFILIIGILFLVFGHRLKNSTHKGLFLLFRIISIILILGACFIFYAVFSDKISFPLH